MYFYIKIDCPFCDRVDKISKANSVHFENVSLFYENMLSEFKTVEDLNLFRLTLYSYYKTKVKIDFIKVSDDIDGEVFEKQGFRLSSDVIKVDDNILAQCVPYYLRKKFFGWNNYTRKYYSNCNLIYQLSYM